MSIDDKLKERTGIVPEIIVDVFKQDNRYYAYTWFIGDKYEHFSRAYSVVSINPNDYFFKETKENKRIYKLKGEYNE